MRKLPPTSLWKYLGSIPWFRSSRTWCGRLRLLTMWSMTSTPRVEPMRHGVHLPHDSMAQNSIAKRASCAMSAVSSCTTTPPWPSTRLFAV